MKEHIEKTKISGVEFETLKTNLLNIAPNLYITL
jgi:hypothetical protein